MNEWTTCAKWTSLQAQRMPPPTEEIFTEFRKTSIFAGIFQITLKG